MRAREVVSTCRRLAEFTEEPGFTTRGFLSHAFRDVHQHLKPLMERAGMRVRVDGAGNLRGLYEAAAPDGPRLFMGSHLDSVPRAGAFDGVLGVVLAVALVDNLRARRMPFAIEVVGFSDEEGVRFGVPFIGSRALAGALSDDVLCRCDATGTSVSDAIRDYGLDPSTIDDARAGSDAIGYLEFHIEQGPVLDRLGLPLGIVDGIVGQSRLDFVFTGAANHAGTTPMDARADALACAAEWMLAVEEMARETPGLVATVGRVDVQPGAVNVIPGRCEASLDIRNAVDTVRQSAVAALVERSRMIATRRGIHVASHVRLDQPSTVMSSVLTSALARAVTATGAPVHHMSSGAGHDAMIVATRMPTAMLFLRSPRGISHHPDEDVAEPDVAAALAVGEAFLDDLARSGPWST